jgi:hypothetical protein
VVVVVFVVVVVVGLGVVVCRVVVVRRVVVVVVRLVVVVLPLTVAFGVGFGVGFLVVGFCAHRPALRGAKNTELVDPLLATAARDWILTLTFTFRPPLTVSDLIDFFCSPSLFIERGFLDLLSVSLDLLKPFIFFLNSA